MIYNSLITINLQLLRILLSYLSYLRVTDITSTILLRLLLVY